jgi:hypothetical protein
MLLIMMLTLMDGRVARVDVNDIMAARGGMQRK